MQVPADESRLENVRNEEFLRRVSLQFSGQRVMHFSLVVHAYA